MRLKKRINLVSVSGQLEIVDVILSGISFAQPSTLFIALCDSHNWGLGGSTCMTTTLFLLMRLQQSEIGLYVNSSKLSTRTGWLYQWRPQISSSILFSRMGLSH